MVLGMCREALRACQRPPREWQPEDVSQTLFSRVLQAAWEPEKAPLGGWLGVIIRRIVTDAVKAAYARRTRTAGDWAASDSDGLPEDTLQDVEAGDPADLVAQRDLRERLRQAVSSLPLEARQLVTLRFIEGHKLQAISENLGIPLATVARRIQKALSDLQRMLGDWQGAAGAQWGGTQP